MNRDDAQLALSRFATSKIVAWDDMESLLTFGFRGEALPSIAAVSRLEIRTREAHAPIGTRVVARGSDAVRVEDVGCPNGTTITVSELFFNTPARRKFLKGAAAETGRIVDLLGKLALAHTDVHFRLQTRTQHGGDMRDVFNFPTQYGLSDRLSKLWHLPADRALHYVERAHEGVAVHGVVGLPPLFAPNRTRQVFFVNGRLIVSAALSQAVVQGYGRLLGDRKFPVAVLFIDVPPAEVDVNVHPTKAEVRFLRAREVFRAVRAAVEQAVAAPLATPLGAVEGLQRHAEPAGTDPSPVAAHGATVLPAVVTHAGSLQEPPDPTPQATKKTQATKTAQTTAASDLAATAQTSAISTRPPSRSDRPHRMETPPPSTPQKAPPPRTSSFGSQKPTPARVQASIEATAPLGDPSLFGDHPALRSEQAVTIPAPLVQVPGRSASRWHVLAQFQQTYIVATRGSELWIVDQHTAHERIQYEELKHMGADGPLAAQTLLFPLLLELPPDQAHGLRECVEVFLSLGYDLQPFGGDTFVVRSVPAGFKRLSSIEVLRRIVAEVLEDGASHEIERLRDKLRATTACRSAVMAGDELSLEEMQVLLERLQGIEHMAYCPHGRPVFFRLGPDEFARLFGRC